MVRIWVMFTCLKRRHYNKAPLVWMNMCAHWGNYCPQLYKLLQQNITIFDEYPVENTHRIIRAQTKPSDTAEQLKKKAKSIFQSKAKQENFRASYTLPKSFSFSHNQLKYLKVKCAEALCVIFESISQCIGKGSFFSKTHVTLPTFFQKNLVKTIVLPLGYQ